MNKTGFKNDPQYLVEICKGLEDLRRSNKQDIRESQITALTEANKTLSDLNKYLFTVATLLIPIIFSIVGIKEIKENLNKIDNILIGSSLIFLFISLLLGFAHMISEIKFHQTWLANTEKRLKLWSSTSFFPGVPTAKKINTYIKEYDSIKSKADKISKGIEKESTKFFIFFQGIFWIIGVVSIAIVAFRLL